MHLCDLAILGLLLVVYGLLGFCLFHVAVMNFHDIFPVIDVVLDGENDLAKDRVVFVPTVNGDHSSTSISVHEFDRVRSSNQMNIECFRITMIELERSLVRSLAELLDHSGDLRFGVRYVSHDCTSLVVESLFASERSEVALGDSVPVFDHLQHPFHHLVVGESFDSSDNDESVVGFSVDELKSP